MPNNPSKPVADRNQDGRFAPGNKLSKGNPLAGSVARLRTALVQAVTPEDIEAIIKTLVKKAKKGDIAATRIILERCLGKPIEHDLVERLEQLESFMAQHRNGVSHAA